MPLLEATKHLDGYKLVCQRRTGVIDELEADYLLGLRSFQVPSVIFPAIAYSANSEKSSIVFFRRILGVNYKPCASAWDRECRSKPSSNFLLQP